jgi:lipopolysaccharide export system protein LptA
MRPAFRSALTGFAVGAAMFALHAAGAQGIAGYNSDAPVNYAADRIELQDKQKRVVLSGNVSITQGELSLRAARTTVA